jgi:thioredoxin-dependent peroxiredoxin
MVEEGQQAPDFRLPADDGTTVSLADLRGKKVVLYFYPKDDTPGCTTQACDLRDSLSRIESAGAVVLGVSPDPVESHQKFKEKHDLNFPLLADEEHQVAEAYGVWKEKSMFGNKFWGVERSTFVIDAEGRLEKVWRRVRPKGHAEKVMAAIEK